MDRRACRRVAVVEQLTDERIVLAVGRREAANDRLRDRAFAVPEEHRTQHVAERELLVWVVVRERLHEALELRVGEDERLALGIQVRVELAVRVLLVYARILLGTNT